MRISCGDDYLIGAEFRHRNTRLDDKFSKLVHLCVNSVDSSYTVLVDILENATPTIESVEFTSAIFEQTDGKRSKSVHNSKVKSLHLISPLDEDADLDSWNEGFKSILNACPSLEEFRFMSNPFECDDPGAIDIDFRGLEKLQKSISAFLKWNTI